MRSKAHRILQVQTHWNKDNRSIKTRDIQVFSTEYVLVFNQCLASGVSGTFIFCLTQCQLFVKLTVTDQLLGSWDGLRCTCKISKWNQSE